MQGATKPEDDFGDVFKFTPLVGPIGGLSPSKQPVHLTSGEPKSVVDDVRLPRVEDRFSVVAALAGVQQMVEALEANASQMAAVEERAKRAEARADEAEHWLRRLHKAVMDGVAATKAA